MDVFATSGAFGILPNHVPSIAVLMPGQLTVHEQDKTAKYFGRSHILNCTMKISIKAQWPFFLSAVSSGTVTINADSSVQILAEEAVPMERLDLQVKHLGEPWQPRFLVSAAI